MPDPRPTPEQAMDHVRAMLRFIGEDPAREGLVDTPARVVKAMSEHFWGYGADPMEPLARTFSEVEGYDELVLLSNIQVHSHCEHHMVPFVGVAHVGYIPAKRLQVQEKLTAQIAGAIHDTLKPHAVGVVIQARHFCMCYRGVQQPNAVTTTSKLYGTFLSNAAARSEFFQLIGTTRVPEGI
jgi:GTP cyclohydrolase I